MSGPRDEPRLLADTIDRLLERLDAAFEAQRRFVANASHELRTPLAMMRTTLDVAIAKPGGVPPQMRELDAELRVDLDHCDRLLESFLALARAQNGRVAAHDQVALEPLITDALCARAKQIATKRLAVETHLSPVEVAGSPTLLARMVENVIENAVRHNQPDGSIELTLAPLGEQQAQLTVDSSGPALDPSAVAQLAQPFKRLGQDRIGSQRRAWSRPLDRRCGRRRAQRQPRATGPPRRRASRPDHASRPSNPATRGGHGMRVLVVEDIPRHANRIAEGLRDQGMAVDVAYDGHEAIAKVNLTAYDVVLLDRDLPGIHGDQLCQLITHTDDPPMILMLTAAGAPTDRVKDSRSAPTTTSPKPFHFPELVLRIRALARRKPTARPRTLQAAGIELDQLTGTITRQGRTITLTAKERAVLEALLTVSPDPLSTEQLLEQVWDENVDPFTNTVKVTIARLRRKLGLPDVIHTTPGIGYRINETP